MYSIKGKNGTVIISDLGISVSPTHTVKVNSLKYQLSEDVKKLADFLIVTSDGSNEVGSGTPGPKGDKGDPGDQGPEGPQGPKGEPGATYDDTAVRGLISGLESRIATLESK